jgi:intergrase/recombinase
MTTPALIVNIALLLALLGLTLKSTFAKNSARKVEEQPNQPPATSNPQPASPELAFKEAQDIIRDASKKADSIVTGAELQSIKIAAESSLDTNLFNKEYSEKIEKTITETQKQYLDQLEKIITAHREFIKTLEQKSITSQQDTENMMKARINELLFSLEQNLTSFLNSSEQQSIESISLELKSARSLIDTYRTQQLQLIDENIVAVLERTLSLVLKNKIDLKGQLDLVYEALEKAKVEKFFA